MQDAEIIDESFPEFTQTLQALGASWWPSEESEDPPSTLPAASRSG